jgi:hypothetical protein
MKKNVFFVGMLALVLVFGLTLSSCGSMAPFMPSPDIMFGEKEPLLAGTAWHQQNSDVIYQFRAGGELAFPENTRQHNWSREGDSVVMFIAKYGDYYRVQWIGTYDAAAQTIQGTWQTQDGSGEFILVPAK